MKTKDEIMKLLKKHKKDISERFAIRTLGLFGSYARGAVSAASDVDIIVEFDEPTLITTWISSSILRNSWGRKWTSSSPIP